MMEGGVNPKKMARSKRASSQRSKAKHSKHHAHGASVAAAVPRERTAAEDSLPSNWERYGDESGSDEDLPPLAEGEVRPKSKGADYRELLSSDVPQLFEESPEMEGMTAMLLANGLGLWDWDSSYLEPASLSSERQAAREASALLTVDLRLLGKSMARLNVAQRLFLEDELFPKQNQVEDAIEIMDSLTRILDLEGATASMKDGLVREDEHLSRDTSVSSGNAQVNADSLISDLVSDTSSFNRHSLDYRGDRAGPVGTDASVGRTGTKSLSVNTGDLFKNSAPTRSSTVSSVWEHTSEMKGKMEVEKEKEPIEVRKFAATAAEAELDDLLDMLDNQVASISLRKDNQVNLPGSSISEKISFSPAYPPSNRPYNFGFQESRVASRPREGTPQSLLGATPKDTVPSPDSAKQLEKNDSSSHAKATDAQDDDFDSWLDSI